MESYRAECNFVGSAMTKLYDIHMSITPYLVSLS